MSLLSDYSYVLGFLIIGVGFVILNYIMPLLISPKSRGARSRSPYESGEVPIGGAWIQFDISYYLFALIFLIFDVELVFMYPWAVVVKQVGITALFEIIVFFFILFMGFLYAHKKAALKWI